MSEYYIYGKNSIRETFRSGGLLKLFTRERYSRDDLVKEIQNAGIPVSYISEQELSRLSGKGNHQGFVCLAKMPALKRVSDIIRGGRAKTYPLILILDGLEDPANLGAILRSADAFGVDGIVIKNTGNVPLNATVAKVSTGAVNYVPVAGVSNLSQAISELKDAGYWIVSSDGSAEQSYDEISYDCPIALIVGSEGFGISRLVLERSDFVVKIPMVGHVNSLNASVATGILLAHISITRNHL